MEILALIVSLAALGVAVAALYLASLRSADVIAFAIEDASGPEDVAGAWQGPRPPSLLVIAVYIWNAGAQGGVLQGLGAFDLTPTGPWRVVASLGLYPTRNPSANQLDLPMALEAGDAKTAYLLAHLHYTESALNNIEDFARSLRELETISLDLEWTYHRVVGFARRLRRRKLENGETKITIPCWRWRGMVIERWASNPDWAHLAELARGRAG